MNLADYENSLALYLNDANAKLDQYNSVLDQYEGVQRTPSNKAALGLQVTKWILIAAVVVGALWLAKKIFMR